MEVEFAENIERVWVPNSGETNELNDGRGLVWSVENPQYDVSITKTFSTSLTIKRQDDIDRISCEGYLGAVVEKALAQGAIPEIYICEGAVGEYEGVQVEIKKIAGNKVGKGKSVKSADWNQAQ